MRDIEQYKIIYNSDNNYGNSGHIYFDTIKQFIVRNNPSSILDYGCGKDSLINKFKNSQIEIDGYDPAIKGREIIPKIQYDMIFSTDFFEHLYPDEIADTCSHMLDYSPKSMYHIVSLRPAHKILPNGTNAHKTIEDSEWWNLELQKCFKNFKITYTQNNQKVGFFKLVK